MEATALETSAAENRSSGRQYLTFTIGTEEYGMDILRVQEIKGYSGITPLPNTPAHVRGVMNLRGTVIPVVDLRIRFAAADRDCTKFTVVIVVKAHNRTVGLVVDAVSDVLDIADRDLREPPVYDGRPEAQFITGIGTVGEKLVVILDIEKLLTEEETAAAA